MVQSQMVTLPDTTLNAYLVQPAGDGKYPGVVVIHEAYGLNDDIKGIADRFADAGYVALAVDLFGGRNRVLCMFRYFFGIMTNSLGHSGIQDLQTCLDYMETLPAVDAGKLGAIGFCLGGNFAICLACADSRLKVVAPFYGFNPRPLTVVERACPVVGSYPEKDFTAGMGKKLDEALDGYKIPHDIKIYPDAKHSFFNHGVNHQPEAAGDAWERTLAFFTQHIGT